MKMLILISWAIGLARCDKLDRTYLPPPGSVTAGGYSGDLQVPFEFSKENYPSTLEPGSDGITVDGLLSPNYPNIAFDRQVPAMSAMAEPSTNGSGFPFSKHIYNVPSTTTSYAFTETTTVLPVESYASTVPVTTASQGYSTTTSPFDPNLSYEQYLIQQIIDPNRAQQKIPINDPSITGSSNLLNENIAQLPSGLPNLQAENFQRLQPNPAVGSNVNEYVSGQSNKIGALQSKLSNIDNSISSNISPQSSSFLVGSDLDTVLEVSIPTATNSYPYEYNNNQTPSKQKETYKKFQDFNDSIKSSSFSTLVPVEISVKTQAPNVAIPSSKYSSVPTYSSSNDNLSTSYSTKAEPHRMQADADRNAVILNYENVLTPEGFAYSFDTSNGIHADGSGIAIHGVRAKGSYSFTGDDGKVYSVEYTADENGFLPRGNHLPTAPPIPDAILRGIEQAEKNKLLGIVDDGSYDDKKYGHARYQGITGRIPQSGNYVINELGSRQNVLTSKTISSEEGEFPANHGKVLDEIFTKQEVGLTVNPPIKSVNYGTYNKDLYVPKFTGFNKPYKNTLLSSEELENIQINDEMKFINGPRNEVSINNDPKIIENYNENNDTINKSENSYAIPTDSGTLSPIRNTFETQKAYDPEEIQRFQTGYEYSQPQNMFDDNDSNSLQSRFTNTRVDDAPNRDEVTQNDKPFITPNVSFNVKSQKPNHNIQILRTKLNDPYTTTGNIYSIEEQNGNIGTAQPHKTTFYNRQLDKVRDDDDEIKFTGKVFSTLKPEYVSTTIIPNYFQSINTKDGIQRNYPTSTFGSQYSASTTPIPSKISSRLFSSTNGVNYPQTTSTSTQVTSTLRPSISPGKPGITSSESDLRRNISGQFVNSEIFTTKPNGFDQRDNRKPLYQGRADKTPENHEDIYKDLETRLGVSVDSRSQSLRVSSSPDNFGSPSSTEKLIGEDFSGPKQPQRYDPEHGYYY